MVLAKETAFFLALGAVSFHVATRTPGFGITHSYVPLGELFTLVYLSSWKHVTPYIHGASGVDAILGFQVNQKADGGEKVVQIENPGVSGFQHLCKSNNNLFQVSTVLPDSARSWRCRPQCRW